MFMSVIKKLLALIVMDRTYVRAKVAFLDQVRVLFFRKLKTVNSQQTLKRSKKALQIRHIMYKK